jgi:hypothetical protein
MAVLKNISISWDMLACRLYIFISILEVLAVPISRVFKERWISLKVESVSFSGT